MQVHWRKVGGVVQCAVPMAHLSMVIPWLIEKRSSFAPASSAMPAPSRLFHPLLVALLAGASVVARTTSTGPSSSVRTRS